MKESEVIQLLQHYRHDLLNQLQLVQGYLSMNKKNKVEEKLEELFSSLNEERKLTSLQAPKFAIWLLHFNHIYKNFRITYQIDMVPTSLVYYDDLLVMKCKDIMRFLEEQSDPYVLYDVKLIMKTNETTTRSELSIFIHGLENFDHSLEFLAEHKIENVNKTENGIIFRFEIPKGCEV